MPVHVGIVHTLHSVRGELVAVGQCTSEIIIHVIDDGYGFEPDKLDAIYNLSDGGYGLFSISERLGNVGGEFVIQSQQHDLLPSCRF